GPFLQFRFRLYERLNQDSDLDGFDASLPGLVQTTCQRRLRVREFLLTNFEGIRGGGVLFTIPREFFAYFLAAIGFCQRLVSQIGYLISRFDECFFLAIEVQLERLDLSFELTEFFLFFMQESLFE